MGIFDTFEHLVTPERRESARLKAKEQVDVLLDSLNKEDVSYKQIDELLEALPKLATLRMAFSVSSYRNVTIHYPGDYKRMKIDSGLMLSRKLSPSELPWLCLHGMVTSIKYQRTTLYFITYLTDALTPKYLCIPGNMPADTFDTDVTAAAGAAGRTTTTATSGNEGNSTSPPPPPLSWKDMKQWCNTPMLTIEKAVQFIVRREMTTGPALQLIMPTVSVMFLDFLAEIDSDECVIALKETYRKVLRGRNFSNSRQEFELMCKRRSQVTPPQKRVCLMIDDSTIINVMLDRDVAQDIETQVKDIYSMHSS